MNNEDNILHITVGAGVNNKFTIAHDLHLLKAALLYADKVKLISLTSSMFVSLLQSMPMSEDDTTEYILGALSVIEKDRIQQFTQLINQYRELKKKKYRSSREIILVNNICKLSSYPTL